MPGKNTIVINGKVYDAITGLPVVMPSSPVPVKKHAPVKVVHHTAPKTAHHAPVATQHAGSAHAGVQRSKTLRRDVVKQPTGNPQATAGSLRHKPSPHVTKSPHVNRFAPHPQVTKPASAGTAITVKTTPKVSSIVAEKHRAVAAHTPQQVTKPATLSSRVVKEQLIAQQMTKAVAAHAPAHTPKKRRMFSGKPRALSVATAMLAVMVFGGYLTYLNMPGLSVRVAASQAGIAANYPDYSPDGYRFSGPVAYAPGQVAMKFQSNGSDATYTVTQQKSTWDSQAVHDNLVASTAGEDYVTNSQQGLTIYTFKNNAAWVNRGILYTVSGNAPLSNEQLLRIAGSM